MGWDEQQIPDLGGSTALVTGANSGLGKELSRMLAEHGARVLMGCRDLDKGRRALEEIEGSVTGELELVHVDLADLDAIAGAAEQVRERADRLDALVCNAGVMALPRTETADGFEMQLGVNHLGHFALVGRLLELVLAAGGRVVATSSGAHRFGSVSFDNLQGEDRYTRWGAYGQSKLANLLFVFELQRRLATAGERAIAVAAHPGYAATNLQEGPAVDSRVPGMGQLMQGLNAVVAQSERAGALPLAYAATMPDVSGGEYFGPDGPFESRGAPTRVGRAAKARDPETARRLWERSEQLTGVSYPLPEPPS